MNPPALGGQTALVTGGAQRIGRAIALALAYAGAGVVIHYHQSGKAAESLRQDIEGLGVPAWIIQADLSKPEGYQTLIEQAETLARPLTILVNNASVFKSETLEALTWESLTASLQLNAWAPWILCQTFAARCQAGAIINLIDTRVEGFDWGHAGYSFSKHCLAQMTRVGAVQFAPAIRVNGVAPGLILPPAGENEAYLDRLSQSLPLKRHGRAEDVADAVVYLAAAQFVTGVILPVDGGRQLKLYAH